MTIAAIVNRRHLVDQAYISICDTPIPYKIGKIDPGFNITQVEFADRIQRAANIWGQIANKPLFIFDTQGYLTISMDYDARQSLSSEIDDLQKELTLEKNSINPQEQEYIRLARDFEARLAALNTQIDYWNSQGGAPREEYQKLIEEQKELKNDADRLNQMAQSLNRSTQIYNAQIGQLNKTVGEFNSAIKVRPEEGLYSGADNTIVIYLNRGQTPLVHTLTHELGHALGMHHASNSSAIMYSQTNDLITPLREDIEQLQNICRDQFFAIILADKLGHLLQQLRYNYLTPP